MTHVRNDGKLFVCKGGRKKRLLPQSDNDSDGEDFKTPKRRSGSIIAPRAAKEQG